MKQVGFFYNMDICAACGACQSACIQKNKLKSGEFFRRLEVYDEGPFSGSCNHCTNALCVEICPTGAMCKGDNGLTLHDDGKCIGCGACANACPYKAIHLSESIGVAKKCDGCEGEPRCVKACPTGSLQFGDIEGFEGVCELDYLPPREVTEPNLKVNPSKRYISQIRGAI